jgi:O-antigen ligase
VTGAVAGLLVVKLGEDGYWTHQVVVALGGVALAAVGAAVVRGFTLVEIYCIAVIWVSTFSGLLGDVIVGPISANGAWTLIAVVAGGVLWITSPRKPGLGTLSPLLYFAFQGIVYLVVFPTTIQGIQSVLAVVAFVVCILIVASSGQHARSLVERISTTFRHISWIAITLYGASVAVWGLGNGNLFGPRGFALLALIPLAWNFARWRYGDRSAGVRGLGLLGSILLSLSRLATVIGLIMWPLSRMSSRATFKGSIRIVALIIASVAVFYAAFQAIAPLRDRFVEGDLKPVGGVSINVSGRGAIWSVVWQSALTSPWIGQGAGSSATAMFGYRFKVDHPHNEYLRVFHDFGLLGLLLWLWGFFVLLRRTFRAWRHADREGADDAYVHLAAWLGLVSLGLGMITDNPLRYVQVLLPLGITVGSSLGLVLMGNEQSGRDAPGLAVARAAGSRTVSQP